MVWLTGLIFNPVWNSAFSFGLWRNPDPPTSVAAYRKMVAAEDLRFHRDGAEIDRLVVVQKVGEGTDGVKGQWQSGCRHTNRRADATVGGTFRCCCARSRSASWWSAWAAAWTCSAVARHPTIQRVDVVEISPEGRARGPDLRRLQ